MQLFLDSCNLQEVRQIADFGILDGLTTNPSLLGKDGSNLKQIIADICKLVKTSVSVEVIATVYDKMLDEALRLHEIDPEVITVKLPMTWDGLKTCAELAKREIKTNVTLCFSVQQALAASRAGATFVSAFIGRVEDAGSDAGALLGDIRLALDNCHLNETLLLAASIRNAHHVSLSAKIGADIATIPYKVFHGMLAHPLTEKGLDQFLKDASSGGYKI